MWFIPSLLCPIDRGAPWVSGDSAKAVVAAPPSWRPREPHGTGHEVGVHVGGTLIAMRSSSEARRRRPPRGPFAPRCGPAARSPTSPRACPGCPGRPHGHEREGIIAVADRPRVQGAARVGPSVNRPSWTVTMATQSAGRARRTIDVQIARAVDLNEQRHRRHAALGSTGAHHREAFALGGLREPLVQCHEGGIVDGWSSAATAAAASCSASAVRSGWTRSSRIATWRTSPTGWTSCQPLANVIEPPNGWRRFMAGRREASIALQTGERRHTLRPPWPTRATSPGRAPARPSSAGLAGSATRSGTSAELSQNLTAGLAFAKEHGLSPLAQGNSGRAAPQDVEGHRPDSGGGSLRPFEPVKSAGRVGRARDRIEAGNGPLLDPGCGRSRRSGPGAIKALRPFFGLGDGRRLHKANVAISLWPVQLDTCARATGQITAVHDGPGVRGMDGEFRRPCRVPRHRDR